MIELNDCVKCEGRSGFFIDRQSQPACYKPRCMNGCHEIGWYLDRTEAVNDWNDINPKK